MDSSSRTSVNDAQAKLGIRPKKLKLSVLMPVFNGELHLKEAIESVLGQHYQDFEFIIVDDGSTDGTSSIIDSYSDPRIVKLRNESNEGIVIAMNRGLAAASGEFIARLDADDIAEPERFSEQLRFLRRYPEIGLVGTSVSIIDDSGKLLRSHKAKVESNLKIKWHLMFSNCFEHSSVMFRRDLAESLNWYDFNDVHAEDYGLWIRMAGKTQVANINIPLVKYRRTTGSITSLWQNVMESSSRRLSKQYIRSFLSLKEGEEAFIILFESLCNGTFQSFEPEELELISETTIKGLNKKIVRDLVRNFCDANDLRLIERLHFMIWARYHTASRITQAASHFIKTGVGCPRCKLTLMFGEAFKISSFIVINRRFRSCFLKLIWHSINPRCLSQLMRKVRPSGGNAQA